MITIGYSTREHNPTFKNYLLNNVGVKNVEILEKINDGSKSLSEVYNDILNESKFNFVVLCHDDIEIETNNWVNKLLKIFSKNETFGIIGVAGTTDLVDGRWWTIKESMCGIVSHKHEGKKWTNYYSSDLGNKLREVVIVDGLFFALDKTRIVERFDEEFSGFHFYDIPFCFKNYISGVKIGVTTQIRITHKSIGMTNEKWEENKVLFESKFSNNLPIRLTQNKTFEEKLNFSLSSIGVGMVTYNAENRIVQSAFTIPSWIEHFVIVNDGTPYQESSYPPNAHVIQHQKNMGVGIAKNTALEYLMSKGCEHIFLIEDDILIQDENVFKEYITHSIISGIKHLNFALHGPANKKGSKGFTTLEERENLSTEPNPRMIVPYSEEVQISLYPNCVGAFSYYHRSVIEKIGFFDKKFKNAWEHVDHTYQTIKHGFHPPFWFFADIHESWKFLSEIPNSIKESTIARTPEWHDNYKKGTEWYKKKNGVVPTQTPDSDSKVVESVLINLFKTR